MRQPEAENFHANTKLAESSILHEANYISSHLLDNSKKIESIRPSNMGCNWSLNVVEK